MSKLKDIIESVGLDYKKQICTFIILNIILLCGGFAGYFFLKNVIILAFFILFTVVIDFLYLSRYKTIRKNLDKDELNEFVSLLSFFKVYITNDYTVYQSIKELCNFTTGPLLEKLQTLICEIDCDKTVEPFVKFSQSFHSLQIEQLMICIYQMIDEGNNFQYLTQFEMLFSKLRDDMLKTELRMKESSLTNMTVFPLIGSAVLIVMITFGVVAVIGVSINGV